MKTVESEAKPKPNGQRRMLALLKISGMDNCDLFALEEEPMDAFKRVMVCYYSRPLALNPVDCPRPSRVRRQFRRSSAVFCQRRIANIGSAVLRYRRLVLAAIEAASDLCGEVECFGAETDWPDFLLTTEIEKSGGGIKYATTCVADTCESESARQAFLAHCRMEDKWLAIS